MRYLGSKASVADRTLDLIASTQATGTLCDPFGGIGTVGAMAKSRGYAVTVGDHLCSAHAFQVARVAADGQPPFERLASVGLSGPLAVEAHLNALAPLYGDWLVTAYATDRAFFTLENAARIAACSTEIHSWRKRALVTRSEAQILLASLIESMDRVANTAGTYYAHLKRLHRKAALPFSFTLLPPTAGRRRCHAILGDAETLATSRRWDVLYLDPPYNRRSYPRYYHLPETLARGGEFVVSGRSGMPQRDMPTSPFYSARGALASLRTLLRDSRFALLAFHYAPDGLLGLDQVRTELRCYGTVSEHLLTSQGYTTTSGTRTATHHLFLLRA